METKESPFFFNPTNLEVQQFSTIILLNFEKTQDTFIFPQKIWFLCLRAFLMRFVLVYSTSFCTAWRKRIIRVNWNLASVYGLVVDPPGGMEVPV